MVGAEDVMKRLSILWNCSMEVKIRKPNVSGQFYPGEAEEIRHLFNVIRDRERRNLNYNLPVKKIFGAVLPHAGHIYSGYQTLHFFELLNRSGLEFDTWVVIHPLHRGGEIPVAVEGSDFWNTPLGNVKIDKEFAESLQLPLSRDLHRHEHSSEVILPFIQHYCKNDFSFVSIGMAMQDPSSAGQIAEALSRAIQKSSRRICLIASSDFSHYVEPAEGKKMDQKVLELILNKQEDNIYNEVIKWNISVCGYGPIMAVCSTINKLYPDNIPRILARGHSGEVHHSASVVDYVSIVFYN